MKPTNQRVADAGGVADAGIRARAGAWCARLLRYFAGILVLAGFCLDARPVQAADPSFTEYKVKALFLLNFTKYVEWPKTAFATTNSPIIIAVLGRDKFKGELEKAIEAKSPSGRAIVVKYLSVGDDLSGCHILFISASESGRYDDILPKVSKNPVLTVSEHERFTDRSGMINLFLKDGNVRLEINLVPVRETELKISSKLLGVADVVKGKSS